jgi:(S)-ureidoglycine aminohydrolase
MKASLIVTSLLLSLCFAASAQKGKVMDGVYALSVSEEEAKVGYTRQLLFGEGRDLAFVHLSASAIPTSTRRKIQVPKTEEYLLFVTSGTITITLGDSIHTLTKGSLAMIMPGETYSVSNVSGAIAGYHLMKYRSKLPVESDRGRTAGGSFVRDWNKLTFKPHERGGVRPYFDRATAMTSNFEVHVTTLNAGLPSHPAHTHPAEEIILVLEGQVEMMIGDKPYKAKAGDALYVTTGVLHGLKNDGAGQCSYFAIQWY